MKLTPIGIIYTPFEESAGTPIQPRMAKDARGRVEILPPYVEALENLDGFDRIWLLTWLDRAKEPQMKVIPYMDDSVRGLFATRAPSRPNPIGLSCVRLLGIEGNILHVAEVDLLNATPVLDIKPYSPRFDSYPEARAGWLEKLEGPGEVSGTADHRFERK